MTIRGDALQLESQMSSGARAILLEGLERSDNQAAIFDVRTLPSPWDIKDRSVMWCVEGLVAEGGVTMVSGPENLSPRWRSAERLFMVSHFVVAP